MDEQYRVIRGKRIEEQLSEDSTVPQLRSNITSAFPNTQKRQHATSGVAIDNIEYTPYLGTKMLHVRSMANQEYKQALQFVQVSFAQQPSDQTVTILATDGTEAHLNPIVLQDHNVKVRCSCLDFYFRFAVWNFNDNSIVGRAPKPYRRTTTTRPEANPDHVPGLCKHLLKLIEVLRQDGIIRQS